jgi:O-antigen ligase
MVAWLCGTVLALSVLLGGGTHAGFLGDVFVQLLSIPLLAASLWSFSGFKEVNEHQGRSILFIIGAVIVVFAIQLIPLPFEMPSIGGALTGRGSVFGVLGQDSPWLPMSATPQATWAAAASIVVPAALFFGVLQLSLRHRLILAWLLLLLGGFSLLLGFLQMAQGPGSGLRFYDVTNPKEAVGLFANRNHFAAHLYVTLVLAAAWYVTTVHQTLRLGASTSRSMLWSAAAAVFFVSVVAGLAMARSRAGLFLAMVALIGVILMVLRQRKDREEAHIRSRLTVGRMSIIAVVFSVVFAAQFGLGSILTRFEGDPLEDLRVPLAGTTFEAALRSLPFGTGLGSFVPVYAVLEKESDLFTGFANRAHNDLAEVLLESGIFGLILLAAFLAWFFPRAYTIWLKRKFNGHDPQLLLQRAGTLIIVLLLAHSLVDYPLRTTALSSIFVFFCAVLAVEAPNPKDEAIRHKRQRPVDPKPPLRVAPAEKWGSELPWPDGWQKPL